MSRGSTLNPAEVSDLATEAGRPLTDIEAQQYRRRKIHQQAVEMMLAETRKVLP